VALLAIAVASSASDELSAGDGQRLDAGAVVMRTRAVADFPWPETTAYRAIRATPAEVLAVYADFASQSRWVPDLVASRVLAREAPNAFRVSYEYEVAGPNERYSVSVTVGRRGSTYDARWRLIEARYARRLTGELVVQPRGAGALAAYTSRVDPGRLGVAFGTPESVARRLSETAEALANRVERMKTAEPAALSALVETLRTAVGSH